MWRQTETRSPTLKYILLKWKRNYILNEKVHTWYWNRLIEISYLINFFHNCHDYRLINNSIIALQLIFLSNLYFYAYSWSTYYIWIFELVSCNVYLLFFYLAYLMLWGYHRYLLERSFLGVVHVHKYQKRSFVWYHTLEPIRLWDNVLKFFCASQVAYFIN